MKYIDQYETIKNVKIGDFVRIKKGKSYPEYQNKIFQVFSIEHPDEDGKLCGIKKNNDIFYFYDCNLIKATKQEIDIEKYNL